MRNKPVLKSIQYYEKLLRCLLLLLVIILLSIQLLWNSSWIRTKSDSEVVTSSTADSFLQTGFYPLLNGSKLIDNSTSFLLNLTDFKYRQNGSSICNNPNPINMIIVVHTAVNHRALRSEWRKYIQNYSEAIAQSGGKNFSIKLAFMLGLPLNEYAAALSEELRLEKDIVQGNFVDSYKNLTYKHVMALKWAVDNCPNSKFIVKVDDDTFLSPTLLNIKLQSIRNDEFIYCLLHLNVVPERTQSKWIVTNEEYPRETYPTFCNGNLVVYTHPAAKTLISVSTQVPYFWIDDVFVTGLLRERAPQITLIDTKDSLIPSFLNYASVVAQGSNKHWFGVVGVIQSDLDVVRYLMRREVWCVVNNCSFVLEG